MPYDMPMSLEEALADPETRRRALALAGMPESEAPAPVPEEAQEPGNQFPEPAGTTGTDLVQRYLAAQGADAQQARLNALGEGFGNAASTILGAAGVPYVRSRPEAPRGARDVLDLERVRSAAARPAGGGKAAAPASPEDIAKLHAFARARWPDEPDAVIAAIAPERFESIRKTLDQKYGIKSREGLAEKTISATDERARLKREQDAQKWAEQRGLKWAEMGLDERELAEKIAAREAAAAAKREEQLAGATERFGEEVDKTGATKFYQQYDEAQAILAKYPNDIPGIGRLDGRKPDEALTPDGRQMRFLVGQLLSEYRKGQTGAGMSDAERVEYGEITGLLNKGSDDAIRQGLDTLRRALDARVKGKAAGFRPEAVERYGKRNPRVGKVTRGDVVSMVNKKGKRFKVPTADVPEAERRGWKRVQ